MEKGVDPSLFVNDGSFMEKFKQMQQEIQKKEASTESKPATSSYLPGAIRPTSASNKIMQDSKSRESQKSTPSSSNGKLAFSLKQKSKLAVPSVKLGAEEEEEDECDTGSNLADGPVKRQKLGQPDAFESVAEQGAVAPFPPSDPSVKKVADRLANFVAKHGRQFENITRQKNPGDTPFKFLFDIGCPDYKYYEYRLAEEEKILPQTRESQASSAVSTSGSSRTVTSAQRSSPPQSNFHIPASALYESTNDGNNTTAGNNTFYGEASAPPTADPIAMMEYYMKKAAQEERRRPPKQSKDEMPPPASLQAPKKGHHMGDYIPQEELERFLATCNDAAAQKAAREAAERAKIQADNVGHKLLSKMGWKEGEGLGSSKSGRADPVLAGNVKLNNLGVGAEQPGEVTPEDDIYEQYKKRMMLGYRYRPNPLNNPRKAYY